MQPGRSASALVCRDIGKLLFERVIAAPKSGVTSSLRVRERRLGYAHQTRPACHLVSSYPTALRPIARNVVGVQRGSPENAIIFPMKSHFES
jgi:hypothetical protein